MSNQPWWVQLIVAVVVIVVIVWVVKQLSIV